MTDHLEHSPSAPVRLIRPSFALLTIKLIVAIGMVWAASTIASIPLLKWVGMAFFGLAAIAAAAQLFPSLYYLRFSSEGFTVRNIGAPKFYSWSSIERIDAIPATINPLRRAIALRYHDSIPEQETLRRRRRKILKGYDVVMQETYGMKATDLVALLRTRCQDNIST